MKTKIIFCFLVIAVFSTSQILANQSVGFDPEYPALTFLKEKGQWERFLATARSNKAVVSCQGVDGSNTECLKSDYVAKGAFVFASKNQQLMNLVAENQRSETAYMDLFMAYNSFPKGGGLPLEQFQKLATGQILDTGILYPVNSEYLKALKDVQVAQAPQAVQSDAPANAVIRPAMKPEVLKPSDAEVQIGNLQKQVTDLKKTLAGNTIAGERVNVMQKQLDAVSNQIKNLSSGQTDLAQNQAKISYVMQELEKTLSILQADYRNEINVAKTELTDNFNKKIEAVGTRIERMSDVIIFNERIIVGSLSGAIVVVFLFFWFSNRKTRRMAVEAKSLANDANFKALSASNLLQQTNATLKSLEVEVDEIFGTTNDETKGLCVHDQEKITPDKTAFLVTGSNTAVMVEFSGKVFEVIFERFTDDSFVVHGVKRSGDAEDETCIIKHNTNFVRFLKKAYRRKCIIGVTSVATKKAA